jgi:hypothetical protein
VEALARRVELDGDLERARARQHRGRAGLAVDRVDVGEVVDQQQVVAPAEGDGAVEEGLVRDAGRGVVGVVEHQRAGPVGVAGVDGVEVGQEAVRRAQRERDRLEPGDRDGPEVRGVGGVGQQDGVAGVGDRPQQVGEALLRADELQRVRVRVERAAGGSPKRSRCQRTAASRSGRDPLARQ